MMIFRPDEQGYHAAREAAVVYRHPRAVLRGEGVDRLDLLHRLSTNQLRDLAPGSVADTVLTSDKGRILEVLKVVVSEDHLLLILSGSNALAVRAWLDRYTIMDDFRTDDLTAQQAVIGVYGTHAKRVVEDVVRGDMPDRGAFIRADWLGFPVTVTRDHRLGGAGGFLLVADAAIRDRLVDTLVESGAVEIDANTYHTLRIEAGLPAIGLELTDEYNPLEAKLTSYVSFTKGCYIGQEVIARLDSYDKVQRHLVGLTFEGQLPETVPGSCDLFEPQGAKIGTLTSVAWSPAVGTTIALGFVRSQYDINGSPVEVRTRQAEAQAVGDVVASATITSLPFDA